MTDGSSARGKLFVRGANTRLHIWYSPASNIPALLLFGVFFLLGLAALLVASVQLEARAQLAAQGVRTEGVIETTSPSGKYDSLIRVGYHDSVGKFWRQSFRARNSAWTSGQTVTVIYVPASPRTAVLWPDASGGMKERPETLALSGVFGVLFGGAFLWRTYVGQRNHRR